MLIALSSIIASLVPIVVANSKLDKEAEVWFYTRVDRETSLYEDVQLNMNDGSVTFDYLTSDCSGKRSTADVNYFSRTVQGVASDGTQGFIGFVYYWSQLQDVRTIFILFGDSMMSADDRTVSDIRVTIYGSGLYQVSETNVGSGFFTLDQTYSTDWLGVYIFNTGSTAQEIHVAAIHVFDSLNIVQTLPDAQVSVNSASFDQFKSQTLPSGNYMENADDVTNVATIDISGSL